jgi:hypothetical protein
MLRAVHALDLRRMIVSLVAVLVMQAVGGCVPGRAENNPAGSFAPLPSGRVYLPWHPDCTSNLPSVPCVEVGRAISGKLSATGSCLSLKLDDGLEVSVIWPAGYSAAFEPLRIYDATGTLVATADVLIRAEGSDPTPGDPDDCGLTRFVILAAPIYVDDPLGYGVN